MFTKEWLKNKVLKIQERNKDAKPLQPDWNKVEQLRQEFTQNSPFPETRTHIQVSEPEEILTCYHSSECSFTTNNIAKLHHHWISNHDIENCFTEHDLDHHLHSRKTLHLLCEKWFNIFKLKDKNNYQKAWCTICREWETKPIPRAYVSMHYIFTHPEHELSLKSLDFALNNGLNDIIRTTPKVQNWVPA